jgi:hexosaminidase
VDGDLTTRWSSAYNDDPQWLCVDLGKSQHIGRVKLTWESAFAKDYQIQVSDDNANWTTIYQTTTGNGGTEDLTGLNGQGRYIRMYATKRATQWGDSLFEFEVYGPPAKH